MTLEICSDYFKNIDHATDVQTRNSSGDVTANVNFLYDDIAHVLQSTAPPSPPRPKLHNSYSGTENTKYQRESQASKHNGKVKLRR